MLLDYICSQEFKLLAFGTVVFFLYSWFRSKYFHRFRYNNIGIVDRELKPLRSIRRWGSESSNKLSSQYPARSGRLITDSKELLLPKYSSANTTNSIRINSLSSGILHSYLRHSDQWIKLFPKMRMKVFGKVNYRQFRALSENIRSYDQPIHREKFVKAMTENWTTEYDDSLHSIQRKIYNYLRTTISDADNALGWNFDTQNKNRCICYYRGPSFGFFSFWQTRWILKIVTSETDDFSTWDRQVFTILTAYFIPESEYEGMHISRSTSK